MNAPCPTKYTTGPDCPCETSPFQNISAELPDVADFICLSSVPTEAHLGDTWQRNACTRVGHSTISQEDACNVARANALACVYYGDLDSNGIQRPLVGNKKIDTVVNGVHVVIPGNTYFGGNQTTADTIATSFAAQGVLQFSASPATFLARLNQLASDTISVIGGTGPFTWLLSSGSLPPGISLLNGTGTTAILGGTPTATGTFTFALQVFDIPRQFTVKGSDGIFRTVNSPGNYLILPVTYKVIGILNATPLPFAVVGKFYIATFIQGGLDSVNQWSLVGSLPAGLIFNGNSGVLSGTPNAGSGGSYAFTVSATDFSNNTATKSYTLAVGEILNPTPLPNINQNKVGASVNFNQIGLTAPITWSVSAGSLPNGMTLSAGGVMSGTPTVAAVFSFTIKAAATNGDSVSKDFTITILAGFVWSMGNWVFTWNVGAPASSEAHAADGTTCNMYLGQQRTFPAVVTDFASVDMRGDNVFVGPYTGPAAHARLAFATQNWSNNQVGLVEVLVGGNVVLSIDASLYASNHAAINFDFVIPASVNAIVSLHQTITIKDVSKLFPPPPVNGDILVGSIQGNCTLSSPI